MATNKIQELEQKLKEVQDALAQAKAAERGEALKTVRNTIKTFNFTAAELGLDLVGKPNTQGPVQTESKVRRRTPPKPKYRNPDNREQTWSGRGLQPKWLKAHLASGRSIMELLI